MKEKENFIYSLMYNEKKKEGYKMNINKKIIELEKRINILPHIKLNIKVIDIDSRRVEVEIKIEKINIGFTRYIEFKQYKDINKLEKIIKHQLETVIKLYFNL